MKKHVVLLSSAAAAPTLELIESLSSSGIAVRIEGLHDSELQGEEFSAGGCGLPARRSHRHSLRNCARNGHRRAARGHRTCQREMARRVHSCLASFVRKSGPARSSAKAAGIPRGGRTACATSGAFAAGRRGPGHRRTQTTARIQELARQSRVFASHFGARREFAWRADVAVVASPGVESEGSRTMRARRHRASGRGQPLGDICHGANRRR